MPPGFRKLAGYHALAALVAALRAHDAQPDRSNGKLDNAQDAAWLTMLLLLNSNSEPDIASFDAQNARLIQLPNLSAARAFAFAASSARFLDGTFVSSEPRRRDPCYFIDRGHERGLVCLRRFVEAADFSHELQRRGTNLFGSDRRIEIEKYFDIPAHSL